MEKVGRDGLSREFLVCFWENVGSCLVNTWNYSLKYGEVTSSQKQAVFTLIVLELERKGQRQET